jgi:AcrR family transcriptional regulator
MTSERQLEFGRVRQKTRTRSALVGATRWRLMGVVTPTVEEAAAAADISRTTAYRYFRTQRELLLAAYPEIDAATLLPPDAPVDPRKRLELVLAAHLRITVEWEPQLRASLRLSLLPGEQQPALRGGRAIRWFEDALAPLAETSPGIDRRALAIAIRAVAGIEPLIWLTDIAGLSTKKACALMTANAFAVFDAAVDAPGS